MLDDVSLEIHRGEIIGIAGVAGNGQQQLTEVIHRLMRCTRGKVFIDGVDMTNTTPLNIIKAGVSHIPADRGAMGVVGDMSVGENLAMKKYRTNEISRGMVMKKSFMRSFADKLIKAFVIKPPTKTPV